MFRDTMLCLTQCIQLDVVPRTCNQTLKNSYNHTDQELMMPKFLAKYIEKKMI